MATNFYFNNFQNSQEQLLIEDLTIEAIKIHGIEVYYLPKTYGDYDYLYGEDDLGLFREFHECEMYINSVDGFGGEGDFLGKFGFEMRDQMTMSVARFSFEKNVGNEANINRQFYELRTEKFEYAGERLNTGIQEIDKLEDNKSFDSGLESQWMMEGTIGNEEPIHDETGERILLEGYTENVLDDIAASENTFIETQADNFIDFTDQDPFSEGGSF